MEQIAGRLDTKAVRHFLSAADSQFETAIMIRAASDRCKGSILRVRNFLPERSVLARPSLSAFDRNLAHWSQLGPAGAFSTSFESWGSAQRGKGIVRYRWM